MCVWALLCTNEWGFFCVYFFSYNNFVIKDREYMYIATKANTRHDPIYKIK